MVVTIIAVVAGLGALHGVLFGQRRVKLKRHARATEIVRTEAEKHGWSEARQAAEHKHLITKRRLGKKKWRHV